MLSSLWNHFWFSERRVLSGSGPCKFCSFKAQFCPALNLISTCLQKISRFTGILHFVQILYLLIFRHFFRVSIAPFVHAQSRRIICILVDFFLPVSFERKVLMLFLWVQAAPALPAPTSIPFSLMSHVSANTGSAAP